MKKLDADLASQQIIYKMAMFKNEAEASDKIESLIADIYKDHEAELKQQAFDIRAECQKVLSEEQVEMDNRTCENCKHLEFKDNSGNVTYIQPYCNILKMYVCDTLTFGCNQWESK